MKKILFILIAIAVSASSCEKKFLDTLPKGLVIAQTTNDFRALLDNADTRYTYNLSQMSGYVDVVSDDSQMDSAWYDWDRNRLHAKNLYAFEKDVWLPDGAADDDVWKQNYYLNTLTSNILEEIHIATDNPKLQKQLIAEAKVHRAFAYLTLVNIYAKHYNSSTAATDLGVPIVKNPVSLPKLYRKPVQEVYDFILSELESAVADLPDKVDKLYSHRPTKASTYAILARTYLYMGNYEKALENANKSLAIQNFLYDYNEIYTGTPRPDGVVKLSRTTDDEMLLHKTSVKSARVTDYYMLDSTSFDNLYSGFQVIDEDSTVNFDLRRLLWFQGINLKGKMTAERAKYVFPRNRYGLDNAAVDYIPISTPEMYLTRAECNARLGNLQLAMDDVNKIRMNRYKTGTYTPMSPTNQSAVLSEVLLERRRELYGKELRLFDIKRLGLGVTHLMPGTNNPGFSVPANDPKLVWPIFYHNIELNPEIEQNPR
ncbi:MAG: RagB/SusD family nutrient uptake outer membrane protein [Chitinophagaceae bacterium]|nr:RagB/SusD family nutrient uptake outer membrane protein [Chitinophagaceae bacterium]